MSDRFSSPTAIHDTLGADGIFAVTYADDLPVACASVSRWNGDMEGRGEEAGEEGWEIKTVTTRMGWMKKGLAGRCIAELTEELVRQERERGRNGNGEGEEDGRRKLRLWIHVVDELNWEYWRRRGWEYVRGYERPAGEMGSKHGFRLLVAFKEVDIDGGLGKDARARGVLDGLGRPT